MKLLKKCPICGEELTVVDNNDKEYYLQTCDHDMSEVHCYTAYCDCGFSFDTYDVPLKEFLERLNTRKPLERIVERLENASYMTECTFDEDGWSNNDNYEVVLLDKAIEIVKEEM